MPNKTEVLSSQIEYNDWRDNTSDRFPGDNVKLDSKLEWSWYDKGDQTRTKQHATSRSTSNSVTPVADAAATAREIDNKHSKAHPRSPA